MEEHPVRRQQDLLGSGDQARFGVIRRIQDLPCHLIRRTHNDEAELSASAPQALDRGLLAHMLKTEIALNAPAFHCFLYPSKVGFRLSANLPIIGIVHLSPGKWAFFALYTTCSRIRREMTIVRIVAVVVLLYCQLPGLT